VPGWRHGDEHNGHGVTETLRASQRDAWSAWTSGDTCRNTSSMATDVDLSSNTSMVQLDQLLCADPPIIC